MHAIEQKTGFVYIYVYYYYLFLFVVVKKKCVRFAFNVDVKRWGKIIILLKDLTQFDDGKALREANKNEEN